MLSLRTVLFTHAYWRRTKPLADYHCESRANKIVRFSVGPRGVHCVLCTGRLKNFIYVKTQTETIELTHMSMIRNLNRIV